MAICWYLLEANIYLTIAYLFYTFLLKRYTFFQQHRFYLLIGSIFSFIIPLISWKAVDADKPAEMLKEVTGTAPSAYPGALEITDQGLSQLQSFSITNLLLTLFVIVAIVKIVQLITGVIKLFLLRRQSEKVMQDDITIILLPQQTVFSFFHWIFSHPSFLNDRMIREHELIHARELHSADIIWFELIKAVNWFNPVSHLLLKSAKINHEFIVDAKLSQKNDPYAYAMMLISHARAHSSGLTHAAFASGQIETRLNRMTVVKSPRSSRSVLLLFFPILLPFLFFSVFRLEKNYALLTIESPAKPAIVSYQQKLDNKPVLQDLIPVDPREKHNDTVPRKKKTSSRVKNEQIVGSAQAVMLTDTTLHQIKKTRAALPSVFPSAADDHQSTNESLHNIENRPAAVAKESVYGKYALLVPADTAVDHDKSLRRAVSVYPENRYADPSVGNGRVVHSVSIYDLTKRKSAFQ